MPWLFQQISRVIPTTWMIDASRGVILRGAGWTELRLHVVVLWSMAGLTLVLSARRFRKQIG